MKTLRRLTYFICAFVLGSGALLASFHKLGLFQVKGVPVEVIAADATEGRGLNPLERQLKSRIEANVKALSGQSIWKIPLNEVRASLVNDEWVRDVLISRSFPNEIKIRVKPKRVALLLASKQKEFIPITDQGELLKALPLSTLPDVPLLRGEVFEREPARRQAAVDFVGALNSEGALSRRNISEIVWSSQEGYSLTLMEPKVEVMLGEDAMDVKALRVEQVLNYLSTNNLKGRVIDASFSKKVLVRLRKGS